MPDWSLELAAEDLRQASPEAWSRFLRAVHDEMGSALERILASPNSDTLNQRCGEARAYRELAYRLTNARTTAEKERKK